MKISDRVREAVKLQKETVQKHEQALKNLEYIEKRSKRLSILWPSPVNSKNVARVLEVGNILTAFKRRLEITKQFSSIADVSASTQRLWASVHGYGDSVVTVNFRSHLNWMKKRGLITYDTESQKWYLTPDGIDLIVNE